MTKETLSMILEHGTNPGTILKRESIPELDALKGVVQPPKWHPEGDAYIHTLLTINEGAKLKNQVQNPLYFMLACLCHDYGKAVTTKVKEDGNIISHGHDQAGVSLAETMLKRMGYSEETIAYVKNMVALHMRTHQLFNQTSSVKATNRLFREALDPLGLVLLTCADTASTGADPSLEQRFLLERLEKWKEEEA